MMLKQDIGAKNDTTRYKTIQLDTKRYNSIQNDTK